MTFEWHKKLLQKWIDFKMKELTGRDFIPKEFLE